MSEVFSESRERMLPVWACLLGIVGLAPVASADLVITELLAVADERYRDEDGAPSDWLEISNTGPEAAALEGFHLTNNRNDLTRWTFPQVEIPAGGALVVYASGKDRSEGELHTSFTLDRGGDYLALVAPDGMGIVSELAPRYPEQFEGVSFGVAAPDNPLGVELGYFRRPTPGAPNGAVSLAPAAEVAFSETSRMFTTPFRVELSCPTPGAVIRYTTNRSVPTTRSTVYSSPIPVTANTQLRARAFLPDALDGEVTAHTYLKMAESVPVFSSNLPVIVISTFGTGTPPDTNSTTRQEAAMLFFEPDPESGRTRLVDSPVLVTRAGIRRRGSSSGFWPKYSLSVETWRDGDNEDRNIEPLGMPREADWILNARYEWDLTLMRNPFVYKLSRQIGRYAPRTTFVEVFSDTSGSEVSDLDYFGVYSLIERIETDPNRVDIARLRPWENSEPEITGGYIFKNDRPDPGEPTLSVSGMGQLTAVDPDGLELSTAQRSWITAHLNELDTALVSVPSGFNRATRKHFSDYIDVDSWIDHHWLNILVQNIDWGRHSAFFHKDRDGKIVSGPVWDFDRSLGCEDVRDDNPRAWEGGVNAVGTVSSKTWFDSRYPWYGHLLGPTADPAGANYPDVRQSHTDRWHELRQAEFSLSNLYTLIDSMADEIREAQRRNFVRWREFPPNGGNFATPDVRGWEAEISHMKGWLKARVDWLDAQYMEAPSFNSRGGPTAEGFELLMGSPDAPVYFTTDGSDPRRSRGGISANAFSFSGVVTRSTVLGGDSACRYHVPSGDEPGLEWTTDGFDDSGWMEGHGGIGFESGRALSPLIDTEVGAQMAGKSATCYVRYPFELADPASLIEARLEVYCDDGFVAYLNGVEIGSLQKPVDPSWNSATANNAERPGGSATVRWLPEVLDLVRWRDLLRDGPNVLAFHGLNAAAEDSDFVLRPGLTVTRVASDTPLAIEGTQTITARAYRSRVWSAPARVTLVVSDEVASRSNLVVSEFMYNPPDPSADELAVGFDDADLFEYFELLNIGGAPVSLAGLRFSAGLSFDFSQASPSRLEPGERGLLVRNRAAFEMRYGEDAAARIIGEFAEETGLADGGERIRLTAVDGSTLLEFKYEDDAPWPAVGDGEGYSLVLRNPFSAPDHGLAESWQPGSVEGGRPGEADLGGFAAWAEQFGVVSPESDLEGDGRSALLEFAEGGSPLIAERPEESVVVQSDPLTKSVTVSFRRSLSADGVRVELEVSDDLEHWSPAGEEWEFRGSDRPERGTAWFSFRTGGDTGAGYVRQRVTLREGN